METYQISFKRNLRHITPTIIILSLAIIFFIVILISEKIVSNPNLWRDSVSKSAFFAGIILLVAIPGVLLHLRYYRLDKTKKIFINGEWINFDDNSLNIRIFANDILKVEKHTVAWSRRIPWSNYGYIRLNLRNGTSLIWTSLLIDFTAVDLFFAQNGIQVEYDEEFMPWPK